MSRPPAARARRRRPLLRRARLRPRRDHRRLLRARRRPHRLHQARLAPTPRKAPSRWTSPRSTTPPWAIATMPPSATSSSPARAASASARCTACSAGRRARGGTSRPSPTPAWPAPAPIPPRPWSPTRGASRARAPAAPSCASSRRRSTPGRRWTRRSPPWISPSSCSRPSTCSRHPARWSDTSTRRPDLLCPGGVHVIEATHPADLTPSGVHHTEWTEAHGDTTVDARLRMHIDRITEGRLVPVTLEVVHTTGPRGGGKGSPRFKQEDQWLVPDLPGVARRRGVRAEPVRPGGPPWATSTSTSPSSTARRGGSSWCSRGRADTMARGEVSMRRIAVVGSGIAGLLTAHGLRRAGHEVTLFSIARRSSGCASPGRRGRRRASPWPSPTSASSA